MIFMQFLLDKNNSWMWIWQKDLKSISPLTDKLKKMEGPCFYIQAICNFLPKKALWIKNLKEVTNKTTEQQ